ncbi:MAG TPA: HAD family phosphatase [Nitrospirales bacterium]
MLKAIIFDFDGVLADTEPLHFRMFQQVLQEERISLGEDEYYQKYVGFDDRDCFHAILAAQGRSTSPETIRRLVARKAAMMLDHLKATPVVYPGIKEFVKSSANRYRLAIVSGALRQEIDLILQTAGMRTDFEHITSAEDVGSGKPDPEGYLHALRSLNQKAPILAPECLVIEDTLFGIQAAHAAGIRCLAVSTTCPADQLASADAIASTLKGYDLESLAKRFWS